MTTLRPLRRRSCRIFSAVVFAAVCLSSSLAEKLALVGGTAINPAGDKVTPNVVVLIDGDRIQAIGSAAEIKIPEDARRIDCGGKFIIPGLWDMHVHLAGGAADPEWSRDALLPLLIANGVTGVRDMGGNLSALKNWRREIESGQLVGPRLVAAGPFLAEAKPGTEYTLPVPNPSVARHAVRKVKKQHGDFIKILTRLSRESYFAIVEEAKIQELPLVGHVPDSITAAAAAEAGQKSIEHIFYSNLAFDCSAQEAALRQERAEALDRKDNAALARIRTAAEASFDPQKAGELWDIFLRHKTWVCPTLVAIRTIAGQRALAEKRDDLRLACVPPALRAKWTPEEVAKDLTPELEKWYGEQAAYDLKIAAAMHAAGVPLLAGSDSLDPFNYPGSSLHEELKLLVQAGLTPMEALRTATINPARFFGREGADGFGAIEADRLADLVLLDANPLEDIGNTQKILAVVVNGRFLDREELDHMLERARASVAKYQSTPSPTETPQTTNTVAPSPSPKS